MLRTVLDPFRLTSLLSVRLARRTAPVVAGRTRGWEAALERMLLQPVVLHWDGDLSPQQPDVDRRKASLPRPSALAESDLEEWAHLPYAAAWARAAELPTTELRHLLDYERSHGHRARFERLLQHRVDLIERHTG